MSIEPDVVCEFDSDAYYDEDVDNQLEKAVDAAILIPDTHPMLLPALEVVPMQLFAYYVALMRGCDIDKPRNLAKSVTVE